MIKGVSGVPGAGKTYFVVKEIADKYYTFDKQFSEWIKKEKYKEILIITNINQFKLASISITDYMEKHNFQSYEDIFSVDYWQKIVDDNPDLQVIFLIDEAQKYFPSNYRNNDVFYFFQYHRHLGIDIYLTYQSWSSISRKITDLMEFEIRAVRQTFKIGSEFRYHFFAGLDKIGSTLRKSDKMIFALYQSFDSTQEGTDKPPRVARNLLIFIVLLSAVGFFTFKLFVGSFTNREHSAQLSGGGSDRPTASAQARSDKSSPSQPSPGSSSAMADDLSPPPSPGPSANSQTTSNPPKYTRVVLGGLWWGKRLVGIEFFGAVVPVEEFTYPFQAFFDDHQVVAAVPDAILAQVKLPSPGSPRRAQFINTPGGYVPINYEIEKEKPEKQVITDNVKSETSKD